MNIFENKLINKKSIFKTKKFLDHRFIPETLPHRNEQINTMIQDDYDECSCGCHKDGCDCDENCDCGCQDGEKCTCGGKCKCHHEKGE